MIRGIYIHIPFCGLKCPYCDFTSLVSFDKDLQKEYIEAVKRELNLYRENPFYIETIYFGGGTPTTVESNLIVDVIDHIIAHFKTADRLEITIESNPNNYKHTDFKLLKSCGVNRLSFGNQSFITKNLKSIGRDHSPLDTLNSVQHALDAGISNINLDLIYGIPGQSVDDLRKDLEIYLDLPIKHISCYILTPYENTPFGSMVRKGLIDYVEDETLYNMFCLIDEQLSDNGFKRYELSNWSKEGYECKHNMFYWKNVEFLGIGVSAWSFFENKRFGNTKNINHYLKSIERGLKPISEIEILDIQKIREESIFLGLRLTEGVDVNLLEDREMLKRFVEEGYGILEKGRFKLTPKGLMILNYIASRLI